MRHFRGKAARFIQEGTGNFQKRGLTRNKVKKEMRERNQCRGVRGIRETNGGDESGPATDLPG